MLVKCVLGRQNMGPSFARRRIPLAVVQLVKSLISGYVSQPNEYEYWLPEGCVEGEIPRDLDGTLFRNGVRLSVPAQSCSSSRPELYYCHLLPHVLVTTGA